MGGDNMSFSVSKIRTDLMGIAILWIMLFHTSGLFMFPKMISVFQSTGFYGVDIFFFVSAYGLYFSMNRPQTLREWYAKRLKRILPTFFVVATIFGIFKEWTIGEFINEELFIGFLCPWLNNKVEYWYIPSALLFYLLFPLLYNNLKILKKYIIFIYILSGVLFFISNQIISPIQKYPYIVWFIARIPVFISGLIYADVENYINEKLKNNKYLLFLVLFISLCSFINLLFNLVSIPFVNQFWIMLFSLPIIFALSYIIKDKIKILNPVFNYCGTYSLELYLLHIMFYMNIPNLNFLQDLNSNYTYLCSFLLAFPCAWLLNKTLRLIIK